MLNFLKKESNMTYTENGALTYSTTKSHCLDLFATIGALRQAQATEIQNRFWSAWAEDPNTAFRLLFFARDIRGGLGERRVFRIILKEMAQITPDVIIRHIPYIAEYGRFDDLLVLLDTPCQTQMLQYLQKQLQQDIKDMQAKKESISLLAKWLPSVNASNKETVKMAKKVAKSFSMTEKTYRKTLSSLRAYIAILENNLRTKDYTFSYEKQPSRALFQYRKAFLRNDAQRYQSFLSSVRCGSATLNTNTLTPYDIVAKTFHAQTKEEKMILDTTWNALPNETTNENALVVIDGSGSMYANYGNNTIPAMVALSLGIYLAEHNTGAFANHFITFSENPKLVEIKGKDIFEKVQYCKQFNEVANTNIQKVFELILHTAKKYRLPQSELPSTIVIVSDMEFDSCTKDANITNFEYVKELFEQRNYHLPKLVFWDVASRNLQQPVTKNEKGVALVSGFTPRIFSMVSTGSLDPYTYMMDILNQERYALLQAV